MNKIQAAFGVVFLALFLSVYPPASVSAADVIHRVTLEERKSVDTPRYNPALWLINPDMSAVAGVPKKHWKIVGNAVLEMGAGEKVTADAAELQAYKARAKAKVDSQTRLEAPLLRTAPRDIYVRDGDDIKTAIDAATDTAGVDAFGVDTR